MFRFITLIVGLALLQQFAFAKPTSREIYERQQQVLEDLKASVVWSVSIDEKFRLLTVTLSHFVGTTTDVDVRRQIVKIAEGIDGPERQEFLIACLKSEEDSLLRGHIVTFLGRTGSKELLPILAKVASSDPTTSFRACCNVGRSSARRDAIFAIAELTERFPELASNAAENLRTLPVLYGDDPVADARRQVLYQITRDETLLQPFYDRLESKNIEDRCRGLNAFRYLKLKSAPQAVVDALDDRDYRIRSCAIHVLGEIADPEMAEPLMAIAGSPKAHKDLRRSAISALGKMRAIPAETLMTNLLADQDVSRDAAIALDRIHGMKPLSVPKVYELYDFK